MAYQPNTWNPLDIITSEKLNDIEQGVLDASEKNIYGHGGALQPSDGIHSMIYIKKGETMPSNPQPGDTVFIVDGDDWDDYTIVEWNGEEWVTRLDPQLSKRIDKVLSDAKTQSEQLISDNNTQINQTIDEVTKEKIDLALKDADFNAQAQDMADKALADAKANTATVAQQTLDSANDNITQAKSDITDAYKNADGVIDKKIDDTASSITTTINQNKTEADGKISSAQSTATQALNEVSTKVSQTDYDTKTGDLDTRVTKAQTTADGAVTTVGNYKTSNDARVKATETSIAQNAKDITLRATTTDLNSAKSDYNAQIAQVKVDAGKVETTVSNLNDTVNNISIGGRNLLLGTSVSHTGVGNNSTNSNFNTQGAVWTLAGGKKVSDLYNQYGSSGYLTISFDWVASGSTISGTFQPQWNNTPWGGLSVSGGIKPSNTNTSGHYENSVALSTGGYSTGSATGVMFRQDNLQGNITITNLKLESGNKTTDWTPAPEDTVNALASQQVTIDGITDTVSKQGTNIDSVTQRVTTAEGTLTTATNNITGLQTQQTTTSNQVTQEISDRKTGDNNTLQSSKDFTTSSITSAVNGVNSTITQTSNAILAQVGATNLFPNSEFEKDYGYRTKGSKTVLSLGTKNNVDGAYNGTVTVTSTGTGYEGYWTNNIQVQGGQKYSASVKVHYTNGGITAGKAQLDLWFVDSTGARISNFSRSTSQVSSPYWVQLISEGFTAPTNAVYLQMSLIVSNAGAGQVATFTQPILTATSKLQSYTPNDDISSQLSLFKDNYSFGISDDGKLISGLAGNEDSLVLKGKTITLDNDTNVTGDFYAKGGNFKNINAANIVGTNASFFQANFVNAYGHSVDISADGMTVYYSDRFTSFNGDGVIFKQLVNYTDGTSGLETVGGLVTSYKGTANMMMTTVYDQTYKNIGSPSGTGEVWGGDMIGWSRASDHNGNYDSLLTWSNGTAASVFGTSFGFNFYDRINFNRNEIVSGGNFNFLMSSTKFGSGYFGGKAVPSISATWSGNTGGGIAFGNDNVIIFAPGKTKIIL